MPVREILSDLVAEEQSLDQFLQRINPRDWQKTKVHHGWSIQDLVSHLADMEDYAYDALANDGARLADLEAFGSMEALNATGIAKGTGMRPQDVIEWWRGARAKVVEELSRKKANDRVPWFEGDMSAKTFATMRLMETWAHGLDVYAAVNEEPEDTTRLRHIAWLGWATLPHAFAEAGETYAEPIRLEVLGPQYSKWVFGPDSTDQMIKAQAGEWARLAVGRIDLADCDSIKTTGDVAERALQLVRAHL